jgi:hypothetical protein
MSDSIKKVQLKEQQSPNTEVYPVISEDSYIIYTDPSNTSVQTTTTIKNYLANIWIKATKVFFGEDYSKTLDKQFTDLQDTVNSISKNALTDQQRDWLNTQIAKERQDTANKLYNVITTATNTVFYTDTAKTSDMTSLVTVTLSFDTFKNLRAVNTPSGWNINTTDSKTTYTKNIDINQSADTAEFSYYIDKSVSSEYAGLTVTKSSSKKVISSINPAYYGLVSSNNIGDINDFIVEINERGRLTGSITRVEDVENTGETSMYLVIVTKGSATATQVNQSILDKPLTNVSFVSPNNTEITMSGYNVYFSTNSISAGSSASGVTLNINL